MLFTKEHLNGYYNWTPENERSVFDGDASRRLFDRFNGNQVLFIINLLLDCCGSLSIDQGKNIENLIMNKLPFGIKSEITAYNWLYTEIAKR